MRFGNWKNHHRQGVSFNSSSPHHLDYVPWDKGTKRFVYPEVDTLPTHQLCTSADPGRGTSDLQAQVQDTCTTPKVNFRYSFAEHYYRANINSARKWWEWQLAENPWAQRAQSSRPSLVTTDPQQVEAGTCWFAQYIEAMFAHYTTLNNHAEWRWRVYWTKQRDVERACKFIATLDEGRLAGLQDRSGHWLGKCTSQPVPTRIRQFGSSEAHQGATGVAYTAYL
ncbi:hypothetical protein BJ742DRAFT_891579 [Cladochytrium replicatum]|nr:hypothetical protein BJ742DRAFT_891579 [Cladochytrium replicatum]